MDKDWFEFKRAIDEVPMDQVRASITLNDAVMKALVGVLQGKLPDLDAKMIPILVEMAKKQGGAEVFLQMAEEGLRQYEKHKNEVLGKMPAEPDHNE